MADDSDEPVYQRVGRKPMSERDLEAAVDAWRTDHPDADELQSWGSIDRLRRLNRKAIQEAAEQREDEATGIPRWARQQAQAEARERTREAQAARDLEAARRAIGEPQPGVVRRGPGRPGWTQPTFHAAY